ncbi:hypothetical protein [Streptomyces sp. NPDC020780]|uniref:hypothetical protein n=1 Tax=unclassified Streptomyces TaxID=2593676 RepID=UPI003792A2F6
MRPAVFGRASRATAVPVPDTASAPAATATDADADADARNGPHRGRDPADRLPPA